MAIFLGVSKKPSVLLKVSPGQSSFWCVFGGTQKAIPGDLILVYFTASSSVVHDGIKQIYRVMSIPRTIADSECTTHGMSQVETELLLNLDKAIKIREMKEHPIVSQWGAVSRNMQGVTFAIGPKIWPDLREMIVKSNPNVVNVLKMVDAD